MIPIPKSWKKLTAAIAASVIALVAFSKGMDTQDVAVIVSPLLGFIGAQGLADFGKSKAIVESENEKTQ